MKGTSTLLTCMASAGVLATSVLAIKATPKAVRLITTESRIKHDGEEWACTKKEMIQSAWKCYIPATVVGVSTIACIFGVNVLSRRQQASIAGAYALVSSAYKEYKNKVKELYGEEAHRKVMDSIAKEKSKDVPIIAETLTGSCSLDFEESDPHDKRLFFDSFSNRYFESTVAKVLQAEYHLNRNFVLRGCVDLNEFYEFLGLEKTEYGSTVGWSYFDGELYWIDFDHQKAELEDGLECYIIDMVFAPVAFDEDA